MTDQRDTVEIFLVPGFLGFTALSELDYYTDVADVLRDQLLEIGIDARVHSTATIPAGSLRKRAVKLAHEIAARHDPAATSVHLIGHSTGGLDVRLLLSPGGYFDHDGPFLNGLKVTSRGPAEQYADALDKVKTAIGVATPHYGAPVANLAIRLSAELVLRSIGTAMKVPVVRHALALALTTGASAVGVLKFLMRQPSFLRWIDASVLSQNPLRVLSYLDDVGADVGALQNLTQEASDLGNALMGDRPGVSYGSIITGANEPVGPIDTDDPLLYVNTLVYRLAWLIMATPNLAYGYSGRVHELQSKHDADLANGFDVGPLGLNGDRTGDGVVPSASQAYGDILGVFASDHLDCVGHFPHTTADDVEVSGWVRSGAGFTSERFELLWGRVAEYIAASVGVTAEARRSRRIRLVGDERS